MIGRWSAVDDVRPADLRLPPFTRGMRIGLFGGSFDPPHQGHLAVSLVALHALRLDQVWWLVSPHNPLKPNAPSTDIARRVAAARAIARHPRIRVTAIEAALGTTFTADSLARLLPRLPGALCVWMMGADNLRNFHLWRGWQTIAASLPIAVFNRPGVTLAALSSPTARALWQSRINAEDARALPSTRPPAWVFLPSPHIAASSTAMREHQRAGGRVP
jgi:nicotinate-nucleotide adenylyltransferase